VTKRLGKNRPNLGKSGPNNYQTKKCLSVFIKAQLESSNRLHQTPSKLLKYLQQMIFPPKKFLGTSKNSQNDKISPNLVTLANALIPLFTLACNKIFFVSET
jgi:hypothetical protein